MVEPTTEKHKILIADDRESMRDAIKDALQEQYIIVEAENGLRVIELVAQHTDIVCIIMDLTMPFLDGFKTTHLLKSNFSTYHIPIIMLTSQVASEDIINAVRMGADDYIKKPFDPVDLHARLTMNLRRSVRDQNANPLTRLPGNTIIERTIQHRLKQPLAVLYVDLDNFKAYNDQYGFTRGDDVIEYTAQSLTSALRKAGNSSDFLGHIGGDDFVIVSTPDKVESIAQMICTQFDRGIIDHYNQDDQQRKSIVSHDRQGNKKTFPLMSLSMAIVTNREQEFVSVPQIGQIAAEMKHYAKSKPEKKIGSNYVIDRRED